MKSLAQRRNNRYKALPPHTNEAWPPASSGEVSKPFIISIIVVALLIILSLFLFFSERAFVGKAFTGVLGTGGVSDVLVNPVAGDPFFLTVVANIGTAQTAALTFTLNLPAGVSCTDIASIDSLLGWDSTNGAAITRAECINNQVQFEYATYNSQLARTGTFGIARINMNGLPAGQYDFTFSTLDVIDFNDPRQSNPNHDLIGDGLALALTVAVPAADDDNDGVINTNDSCPNTPVGEVVNASGCSISQQIPDADGDGVPDNIDFCPNTAFATIVDANGCSQAQLDADGDGVLNTNDQCPLTDPNTPVDATGCPTTVTTTDTDGDGVDDVDDDCPLTPFGATVDINGCSDSDSDGVDDGIDQCAGTPANELANADGCSPSQITPAPQQLTTFTTTITATVAIPEAIVYTILKDANNRVLVLKREQMLNVAAGGQYVASVAYQNGALVRSKEVLVYDRLPHQGWTIHGSLIVPDVAVAAVPVQATGISLE